MEQIAETKDNRFATIFAKTGGWALKIFGILILIYLGGTTIYAVVEYSTTKSKLLTYGVSDATGSLIAWAVMLIAIGVPAVAIFRIVTLRGKPYHYAAAMVLPLISWGIAQVPANFDARTGEALRYCADRPGGEPFCLDHPGIDPMTRRVLSPMDAKFAEREYRRQQGFEPKPIKEPFETVKFFDALSDPDKLQPKVWVSHNALGCYDLFDNPGVHPRTGEPLQPVTKELVASITKCKSDRTSTTAPTPRTESSQSQAAMLEVPHDMSASREHLDSLRSIQGTQPTLLTFQNKSERPVVVLWKDYTGQERFYFNLGPGQSHNQQTFASHVWIVRDAANGTSVLSIVAGDKPQLVAINRHY